MPTNISDEPFPPPTTMSSVGSCKRFQCQVVGQPRPSVRWYKDGVNITISPRYKFEYTPDGCVVLILENVSHKDQGVYECKAQNCEGSAETSALLYVTGSPLTSEEESDTTTHEMSFRRSSDRGLSGLSSHRSLSREAERSSYSSRSYQAESLSSTSRSFSSSRADTRSQAFQSSEDMTSSFSRSSRSGRSAMYSGIEQVEHFAGEQALDFSSALSGQFERLDSVGRSSSTTEQYQSSSYVQNGSFEQSGFGRKQEKKPRGKMQREEEHPGELDHDILDDPSSRELTGKFLFYDADVLDSEGRGETAHEFHFMHRAENIADDDMCDVDTAPMQTVLKSVSESYESVEVKAKSKQKTVRQVGGSEDAVEITSIKETKTESNVSEITTGDKVETVKQEKQVIAEAVEEKIAKGTEMGKQQTREGAVTEGVAEKVTQKSVEEVMGVDSKKIQIVYEGSDISVNEKESFELKWKIKGLSNTDFSVLKSGKELQFDGRVQIKITETYVIVTVKSSIIADAGDYSIRVKATQKVEGLANVKVAASTEQAKFSPLQGPNITINEGERLELRWKFTAIQKETISIYRNGKKLSTNDILHIKFSDDICTISVATATSDDAGDYVIKSEGIEDVTNVKVIPADVKEDKAPSVKVDVQTGSDISVKEGEAILLRWKISGVANLSNSLSILKDNIQIKADKRIRYRVDGDICTLMAKAAAFSDAGVYSISIAGDDARYGVVNVLVVTTKVVAKESSVSAKKGEKLVMSWNITDLQNRKDGIKILKDGKQLTIGDKCKLTFDGDICMLTIDPASDSDKGQYSVQIDSTDPQAPIAATIVSADVKIEVTAESSEISLKEGDNLLLRWKITGVTAVQDKLIIKRSGDIVKNNKRIRYRVDGDTCTLMAKGAVSGDAGAYSISFTDVDGEFGITKVNVITSETALEEPVTPTALVSEVSADQGNPLVMKWSVHDIQKKKDKIKILKDDAELKMDDRCSLTLEGDICILTINNSNDSDKGNYTIVVDSVAPTAAIAAKVIVTQKKDSKPEEPAIEEVVTPKTKAKSEAAVKDEVDAPESVAETKSEPEKPVSGEAIAPDIKAKPESPVTEKDVAPETIETSEVVPVTDEAAAPETKAKAESPVKEKDVVPETKEKQEAAPVTEEAIEPEIKAKAEAPSKTKEAIITETKDKTESLVTEEPIASETKSETEAAPTDKDVTPEIKVSVETSDISIKEGEALVIRWTVSGVTNLSEQLVVKKDGRTVTSNKRLRYRVDGDVCMLIAKGSVSDDTGIYCIGFSDVEGDYGATKVTVVTAVVSVTTNVSQVSANQGESLIMSWTVSELASKKDSIKIFKDDVELKMEDRCSLTFEGDICTLTITNSNENDKGRYTVKVDDSVVTEAAITAAVIVPEIKISVDNSDISIKEGEKLVIKWTISGVSNLSEKLVVKKDGSIVVSNKRIRYRVDGNRCTLMAKGTVAEDSGVYCISFTDVDVDYGSSKVIVASAKPSVTTDISEVSADQGKPLVMQWTVSDLDKKKDSIKILKDGVEIVLDDRISLTFKGDICILTINNSTDADKGKYTIKIDEFLIPEAAISAEVVTPQIMVTVDNSEVSLQEGDALVLRWTVSGVTDLSEKLTVIKDGTTMTSDKRVKYRVDGDVCTLMAKAAIGGDTGAYSVSFSDVDGDFGATNVKVLVPTIEVMTDESTVSAKEGESINLKWKFSGVLEAEKNVSVNKNEKKLESDDRTKVIVQEEVCEVVITSATLKDQATYSLAVGKKIKDAGPVNAKVIPSIEVTTDLSVIATDNGADFTITWNIKGLAASDSKVKVCRDGNEVKKDTKHQVNIDGDVCTLAVKGASVDDKGKYSIDVIGVLTGVGAVAVVVSEPKIEVLLEQPSLTVAVGENIAIRWKVTGCSNLEERLKIKKNGKVVEQNKRTKYRVDEETCTLLVKGAIADDEAGYTLTLAGTSLDTGKVDVSVTVPTVEAVADNNKTSAIEGEDLVMKWKLSGVVDPKKVNVYKDGAKAKEDDSHEVIVKEDSCEYIVAKAQSSDKGAYCVRIDQVSEEITSSSKIDADVFIPVAEPDQEAKVSANAGEDINLKWKLSGVSDNTKVHVHHEGAEVVQDEKHIVAVEKESCALSVKNATVADQGSYAVHIDGVKDDIGEVNVNICKPVVEALLDGSILSVPEGENIMLKWKITGMTELDKKVSVVKNDKKVEQNKRIKYRIDGNTCTLMVKGAVSDDSANYSIAIQGFDANFSEVDVDVLIPKIKVLESKISVKEGEPFDLEWKICNIPNIQEKFSILKDGKKIKPDDRHQFAFDGEICTCHVTSSQLEDAAQYNVSISGVTIDPGVINVKVAAGPKVEVMVTEKKLTVIEGDVMTLKWLISGVSDPKLCARIYKDGKPCEQDKRMKYRFEGDTCTLLTKAAKLSDAGLYAIRVGEAGDELGQIDVTVVTPKPKAVSENAYIYIKEGEKLLIKWSITGLEFSDEIPTIYKDGTRIKSDERRDVKSTKDSCKLSVAQASTKDEGNYKIHVNGTCIDSSKVNVQVESFVVEQKSFASQLDEIDSMTRKIETVTSTRVETKKSKQEKKKSKKLRGKMQREDENPGLLDHDLYDDPEARKMAGKFLFLEASITETGFDKQETAHEYHFMREAADESTMDEEAMETVVKSTSETTESIIIKRGIDTSKPITAKKDSVSVVDSKTVIAQKGEAVGTSAAEMISTDVVDGQLQEIGKPAQAAMQEAEDKMDKADVEQTQIAAAETVQADKTEKLTDIAVEEPPEKAKVVDKKQAVPKLEEQAPAKISEPEPEVQKIEIKSIHGDITVDQGAKIVMKWEFKGIKETQLIRIYKGKTDVTNERRMKVSFSADTCTVTVDSAVVKDAATYSIRVEGSTTVYGARELTVNEPSVEVLTTTEEATSVLGKSLELRWKITGIANVEKKVQVCVNGKTDTRRTLSFQAEVCFVKIAKLKAADEGTYTLKVDNVHYKAAKIDVTVDIKVVVTVTADNQDITVTEGDSFEMKWTILGVTNLSDNVKLYLNGKPLEGDRYKVMFDGNSCICRVDSALAADSATYTISVQNGEKQAKVVVKVNKAEGKKMPEPVSEDTIEPTDAKAEESKPKDKKLETMSLAEPAAKDTAPAIQVVVDCSEVTIEEGKTLVLRWTFTGVTDLAKQIVVKKDGKCILSDKRLKYRVDGGVCTLMVKSVIGDDKGLYSVDISGFDEDFGDTNVNVVVTKVKVSTDETTKKGTELEADVKVDETKKEAVEPEAPKAVAPAVKVLVDCTDVSVEEGKTLVLRWTISGTTDVANKLAIKKDGKTVSTDKRLRYRVDGDVCTLMTKNSSPEDTGVYSIIFSDIDGDFGVTNVTVSVPKVEVVAASTEVTIDEGQTLVLKWTISGVTEAAKKVVVKKDDTSLTSNKRLKYRVDGEVCTLMAKTSVGDDSGVYSIGFTGVSGDFGTTKVNVLVPTIAVSTDEPKKEAEQPEIPKDAEPVTPVINVVTASTDVNLDEGQTLVLRWTISGTTDVSKKLVVKKDGKALTSDKRLKYRVDGDICTLMATSSIIDDTGVYSIGFSDIDGDFGTTNVNVLSLKVAVSTEESKKDATEPEADVKVDESKKPEEVPEAKVAAPAVNVVASCTDVSIDEGQTLVMRWTISGTTDASKKLVAKKDGKALTSDKRLKYRMDGDVCTLMAKSSISDDTGVYSIGFSDIDGDLGTTNVNVLSLKEAVSTEESKTDATESEADVKVDESKKPEEVPEAKVAAPAVNVVASCTDVSIDEGQTLVMRWTISGTTDASKKLVAKKDGKALTSDKRLKYRVDGDVCTLMAKSSISDDTGVYSIGFSDIDGDFGTTNVKVLSLKVAVSTEESKKDATEPEADVKVDESKKPEEVPEAKVAAPAVNVVASSTDVSIDEGQTLVMRWTISGTTDASKKPVVKKDGNTVKSDKRIKYRMDGDVCTFMAKSAVGDDTGMYTVGFSDIDGEFGATNVNVEVSTEESKLDATKLEADVKVDESKKPEKAPDAKEVASAVNVVASSTDVSIDEGQTLVMRWTISGTTDAVNKLVIKKDGKVVTSDKRIRYRVDGGVCTYMAKAAVGDDTGVYTIGFSDVEGDFGATNVNVVVAKVEVSTEDSKKEGSEVEASVKVDESVKPEEPTDTKPTIKVTVDSADVSVDEGKPLVLKWTISGITGVAKKLTVKKNGKSVAASKRLKYRVDGDVCTLMAKGADADDKGVFSISFTDVDGEFGTTNVKVVVPTVNVSTENSTVTAQEGDTLSLTWDVSGFVKTDASFSKDGKPIAKDKRASKALKDNMLTYKITSANADDSGSYSIKVGTSEFRNAKINVTVTAASSADDVDAKVSVTSEEDTPKGDKEVPVDEIITPEKVSKDEAEKPEKKVHFADKVETKDIPSRKDIKEQEVQEELERKIAEKAEAKKQDAKKDAKKTDKDKAPEKPEVKPKPKKKPDTEVTEEVITKTEKMKQESEIKQEVAGEVMIQTEVQQNESQVDIGVKIGQEQKDKQDKQDVSISETVPADKTKKEVTEEVKAETEPAIVEEPIVKTKKEPPKLAPKPKKKPKPAEDQIPVEDEQQKVKSEEKPVESVDKSKQAPEEKITTEESEARKVASAKDDTKKDEPEKKLKDVKDEKPKQEETDVKPTKDETKKAEPDTKPKDKKAEKTKPDEKDIKPTKDETKKAEPEKKPKDMKAEKTKPEEKEIKPSKDETKKAEPEKKPDDVKEEKPKAEEKEVKPTKDDAKQTEAEKMPKDVKEEKVKPEEKDVKPKNDAKKEKETEKEPVPSKKDEAMKPVQEEPIQKIDDVQSEKAPKADQPDGTKAADVDIEIKDSLHPKIDCLLKSPSLMAHEGDPFEILWKVQDIPATDVRVCKDGADVKTDAHLKVAVEDNICSMVVAEANKDDEATYSVRQASSSYDEAQVTVRVSSPRATETASVEGEKPAFVEKPSLELEGGRRLSIKCSVTGFPEPEVTWFHHGEQLGRDALWDVYTQEGYHCLQVNDPTMLDCEQLVCRVENESGFVQSALMLKKEGNEVYIEPILPPISPDVDEELQPVPPRIEIEVSDTKDENLRLLTMTQDHRDAANKVSLRKGDPVQVLSTNVLGSILARHAERKSKVCYVSRDILTACDDVSSGEFVVDSSRGINKTGKQETKDTLEDNDQTASMPERRKMKSPSPQMTSTPKVKRKERERDSPLEDMKTRLGLKDKSDVSLETVDITDYDDGTTRPMFTKRLRNVTADAGEIGTMECVVSGTPLPRVLWLKNNRPLKSTDGCKVSAEEGKNILIFPKANDEDVGTYTARAMNINGSVISTAEFTLTAGKSLPALPVTEDMDFTTPAYFFQMSSCEVAEGRLARFDCRVVAYPKPDIVWMRDGKVIETADRFKLLNFNNEIYSLLIQDVKIEDTGRYTCWARNKFGEAMTEAYLNVIAFSEEKDDGDIAPKFLTRFYDQQITEGTAMDFKCLIAGRPAPTVTWLLDEIELRDTPGLRLRHKDGMVSLEMRSPKMNQTGNYTCHIKNSLGEATCSAKLTVIEDKLQGKMLPKFLKKFDHITVKENEEVKISCVVVGEPKPAITWMFDHKPIMDTNRRFTMKQDGDVYTLTIKNARFDDVGTVTCKAVNSEGEVYCSANLHVRESKFLSETPERKSSVDEAESRFGYCPTITRRLQDVQVKEGNKVNFECRFMGIPEPDVTWMKDGRVITDGTSYTLSRVGDTCRLEVERVSSGDTGVYTCIVSNSKGKASTTAGLKLEEKKVKERPESAERSYRRDRYTPDTKTDDVRSYKRREVEETKSYRKSYVDTDFKPEASPRQRRRSYESPVTTRYEDLSNTTPKRSYESPARKAHRYSFDLDSSPHDYSMSDLDNTGYSSLKRDYSPRDYSTLDYSTFDSRDYSFGTIDSTGRFDSPRRDYGSLDRSGRYDSPKRDYGSLDRSGRYDSPKRDYGSLDRSWRYDSPKRDYGSLDRYGRYDSPKRDYGSLDRSGRYDSPKRDYGSRMEPLPSVPKMPLDRPSVLNKREESVRLSWLPAPTTNLPRNAQMISYVVESRELPDRDWTKIATSVPSTTYTVRHLRPDKEYEFRVRASNVHGVSEPSCTASVEKRVESRRYTDLPEMKVPPTLPTHRPVITDLGAETVRLAWRPADTYEAKRVPPVSYRLEARELPDKDWMPLSSKLRDTAHYLDKLPVDRDYMIRVRAENDFGLSEPTEPLWLPRATAFPGVPVSRPQIVEIEADRAKLSWDRVDIPAFGLSDAPLRYMIEAQEPREEWRPVARDLSDTHYTIDGLKPATDYRFRIRAKGPAGTVSEPSPIASLYTTLARSRAPVDRLEVVDYEPDTKSVQLSWQRVEIPPYDRNDEPLMYMLEYQEPPIPDWKPLVTGIPTTRYRVMHLDPDRDYNFRVRALTSYGMSAPSPALPVALNRPPVVRPVLDPVTISDVEPDSLRLSWRRPMHDLSQPVTYQIEMLEPPSRDWRTLASGYTDLSYKVTGLKPTKDYQFRVVPHVESRYLDPTPIAAVTSAPVRPRLPMFTPTIKEATPESVQLSWRSAELPAYERKRSSVSYRIEMQEVPSSTWTPVGRRIPETTYTVTGLRPDNDYRFRIVAETDHSSSEPSMAALLHRKPAPTFPTQEPTIKDLSPNIVLLSWTPASRPRGGEDVQYRVEIQSPPGISPWTTLYANHTTPSVRLADLRPDLDYLVRVRAVTRGSYVSEPTLPVYIPRRAVPPRMSPEEPYAVEITSDSVKLQWRSADLPTHITDYAPVTYQLEAIELPGGDWLTVAKGIPHTDFRVTGLNPQKDYSFRVRAENSYGVSDPTNSTTVKTRSVAPIMPSDQPLMYDIGSGCVRLTWRPAHLPCHVTASSSITYTIYVQEEPFKTWRPLVRRIPHTSYSVSGLKQDMAYNFRVEAENEYGTSQPTEPVYLPKYSEIKRPISMPEVSDFDENLTFVKLQWKPSSEAGSHFDTTSPRKYMIETWEPLKREWYTHARGISDTSYKLRDLPKMPEPIFRVRMELDKTELSEPSLPVSLGKFYRYRLPVYRPQLYELDNDTVRLSWEAAIVPDGATRRVRYIIEQREIPETRWSQVVSEITETSYKMKGLKPKSDYEFRVKAVVDGTQSEPSFPVSLHRRPVIPSVRVEAPEVTEVDETSIGLRWRKVDIPAFSNHEEPLSFIIERQELPSYEWKTVAYDVRDSTYRVSDLKPYQDYKFRVRGIYPSGYTEPSPYVPVYRRPSESKLGVFGVESSALKYAPTKTVASQNIPSYTPRTAPPTDFSLQRSAINARMSRLAKIYDLSDTSFVAEASFKSAQPKHHIFRREDAYVYHRTLSPPPRVMTQRPSPAPEAKPVKLDDKYDLYQFYKKTRRHSDAGLEELKKSRERRKHFEDELKLEERKYELMMESQRRTARSHTRKEERKVTFETPAQASEEYASVADRLEDIKCPYIADHWNFPRRHSFSLDPSEVEKVRNIKYADDLKVKRKAKRFMSKTDDDLIVSRPRFLVQDEVDLFHRHPSKGNYLDPGYFTLSKFSLTVVGTKKRRATSPPPRRTYEEFIRYPGYTPYDFQDRSRSVSTSKTEQMADWNALSKSITQSLEKAKTKSDRARSEAKHGKSRASSVYSSAGDSYSRPRSNSLSGPSSSQAPSHERTHFNPLVEKSKTLVSNYTKMRATSVASDKQRSMSVADVKKDPRYSFTPRASVSTISGASTPARHMTPAPDVRLDSRYSAHTRSSISVLSSEEKRGSFDVRSDSRFSEYRRATISATTTNDDLKSKLDSLNAQLEASKPRRKSKSKKVMKFKSSRGEGFVVE